MLDLFAYEYLSVTLMTTLVLPKHVCIKSVVIFIKFIADLLLSRPLILEIFQTELEVILYDLL